jgi:diacylglycerol kinase (ATP)
MSTWLLANSKSRRGKLWFADAVNLLQSHQIGLDQIHLVESVEDFRRFLGDAKKAGATRILVGGGDGTLALAASELIRTEITLGVLPFGTGNSFARDLGIHTDIVHAVEVIAAGNVRRVDVGELGGELFLNVATLGLSVQIARGLTRPAKRHLGPLAYLLPTLTSIRNARPFEVTLTLPNEQVVMEAYQVVIGNGRYHAGPFEVARGANLSSGELIVYAVEAGNPQVLPRYALALATGQHANLPDVKMWAATHGEIRTRPIKRFVVDGELRERTPATFRSHPGELRVLAPELSEETGCG